MIQANELRIGNWVSGTEDAKKYPMPLQVVALMNNEVYYRFAEDTDKSFSFDNYGEPNHPTGDSYGIPLTPEILEKCGFKWNGDKGKTKRYFFKGFRVTMPFCNLSILRDCQMAGESQAGLCGKSIGDNIYVPHLHLLQNIVHALTGTELEFKP